MSDTAFATATIPPDERDLLAALLRRVDAGDVRAIIFALKYRDPPTETKGIAA